ncbi:MAG: T9SS type A sorting domain-containing protein [Bacteroidetes bacterium]|nr:T9SS type A sorting domain-containing protein [Bacteroidota bacterium]
MKLIYCLTTVFCFFSSTLVFSGEGNKCTTMKILEERIKKDPSLKLRMEESEIQTQQRILKRSKNPTIHQTISIPIVVHVIWHDPSENISLEQIQSQIDILNKDFQLKNSDTLTSSHPFHEFVGNANIEFCLANKDPEGKATDGITRTYTDSVSFSGNGTEKKSSSGGQDNWNPTKYMNLWVCNISGSKDGGGTLGYATFPSDLASNPGEDGVVISTKAFGTLGTATAPNNLGRTGTHEVGHWLNLRHIWGDNQPDCGDDFVADTKPSDSMNYGCPTFPHKPNNKCGTDANGEMYMNYMDYVDDACMNMFTKGQVVRMLDAINGERVGLLTSAGCSGTSGVNEELAENSVEVYPNPNNSTFTVNFNNSHYKTITIFDVFGKKVLNLYNVSGNSAQINLPEVRSGVYYIQINSSNSMITKKVFIAK